MKRTMHVVPHSHFDAEVFMTREQTLDLECGHVLSALRLLQRVPEYTFVLDQVALLEPFVERFPEHLALLRQMAQEGRLEIAGGMYVMPDANLPCGESLVRQMVYGVNWCRTNLGIEPRCGWMLDTFGHHPQMPQLMARAGFDFYVFGRGSQTDSPSEFVWRGLDGSEILCHWMPYHYVVLYAVPQTCREFARFVEERYQRLRKHAATDAVMALSGMDLSGPDEHLPNLVRDFRACEEELQLVFSTPSRFREQVVSSAELQTRTADLNPCFQGCYSARIEMKQWNRRLENLLFLVEKLDVLSCMLGLSLGGDLTRLWRPVLFNQFHDLICGSHADFAFERAMVRYRSVLAVGEELVEQWMGTLVSAIDTEGPGTPIVVFNPLSWQRTDVVECEVSFADPDVEAVGLLDDEGTQVPVQVLSEERDRAGNLVRARLLFVASDVPALGYRVYHACAHSGEQPVGDITSNEAGRAGQIIGVKEVRLGVIENEWFRVVFDLRHGVITSLVDKERGEEYIDPDRPFGNTVVREEDRGDLWEYHGPLRAAATVATHELLSLPAPLAADFSHHYAGEGWTRHGPVMAEFGFDLSMRGARMQIRIRAYAGMRRIDVETMLVNDEEWVRYRVAVPTAIRKGRIVQEIPFGALERPEGEYPAQNWMDYCDRARGLALLNRGLPGNNVADDVLMLSLLKCTKIVDYPDAGGYTPNVSTEGAFEKGKRHRFHYALLPHAGDWREARIYRAGLEFNNPLRVAKTVQHGGVLPKRLSFIHVSAPNVVVSALRRSGEGVILRVYEAAGQETDDVTVRLAWPVESATETDLLERPERIATVEDGAIMFNLHPFEIKTFLLTWEATTAVVLGKCREGVL